MVDSPPLTYVGVEVASLPFRAEGLGGLNQGQFGGFSPTARGSSTAPPVASTECAETPLTFVGPGGGPMLRNAMVLIGRPVSDGSSANLSEWWWLEQAMAPS
jgi:hypothetical protein